MLSDLLRYVGKKVTFTTKNGVYNGIMTKHTRHSTSSAIGTYVDLELVTDGIYHPALGSAETENDFSRIHTVRNGKIVSVEAAA